jgi:hypothetical protein
MSSSWFDHFSHANSGANTGNLSGLQVLHMFEHREHGTEGGWAHPAFLDKAIVDFHLDSVPEFTDALLMLQTIEQSYFS